MGLPHSAQTFLPLQSEILDKMDFILFLCVWAPGSKLNLQEHIFLKNYWAEIRAGSHKFQIEGSGTIDVRANDDPTQQ